MTQLDSRQFKKMIESGANHLTNLHRKIDELNVYPVPDGDTGTNMKLTFNSGYQEICHEEEDHVGKLAKKLSRGLLMGARGNSGVILSQIFRGFANSIQDKKTINSKDLADAFLQGKESAYKAVMRPVEGTILTVLKEASQATVDYVKDNQQLAVADTLTFFLEQAKIALENTPNQLKVLKEVGVVDSGGAGFVTVIEGFLSALNGQVIALDEANNQRQTVVQAHIEHEEFGYCTEFIVELNETSLHSFNENFFRTELEALGNSIVVVHDEDLVKVHIHTLTPGDALNLGQRYGEFRTLKIENMSIQHEHLIQQNEYHQQHSQMTPAKSVHKPYGIITCCVGEGLTAYFKEIKADVVISGGQTMNPSAQDFLAAIETLAADTIYLLPNNSNIVMTCNQVKELVQDKEIIVIESKTIPQGLAACIAFNELLDSKTNTEHMNQAIKRVVSGEITYSIKSTSIDGIEIKENDYMGFLNRKLVISQASLETVLYELIDKMLAEVDDDYELVSLIVGENNTIDLDKFTQYVEDKSDFEVEIIYGNQPVYQFFIGLE